MTYLIDNIINVELHSICWFAIALWQTGVAYAAQCVTQNELVSGYRRDDDIGVTEIAYSETLNNIMWIIIAYVLNNYFLVLCKSQKTPLICEKYNHENYLYALCPNVGGFGMQTISWKAFVDQHPLCKNLAKYIRQLLQSDKLDNISGL